MSDATDRPNMRPFVELASFARATQCSLALAAPVSDSRRLPLAEAAGRVLAADALATTDVPIADRSAMDGYALRADDLDGPGRTISCVGRIAAGEDATTAVIAGTCVEIATGAPLPPGADTVVPVEQTSRDGDTIAFEQAARQGQHVSRRGEDLTAGRPIGIAGDTLTPSLLAACAAGGLTGVDVWRRPRVLITPTGDEVVPLGTRLRPGQVYDSNAAGLAALAAEAGAVAIRAEIAVDHPEVLAQIFGRDDVDLIVTTGGTSVGRRDLVPDAVAAAGTVELHGVAVRPGKPLLLGRVGKRAAVGLPGFPTTCMMLGYAVLDPMLRKMGRRRSRAQSSCRLGQEVSSPAGLTQLLPVSVGDGVALSTFRVSSAVSSMARADGWVQIDPDTTELAAGTPVTVTRF